MSKIVLDDYTYQVTLDQNKYMEQRIRLILQPKPAYVPEYLWKKLISRFLVIEQSAYELKTNK